MVCSVFAGFVASCSSSATAQKQDHIVLFGDAPGAGILDWSWTTTDLQSTRHVAEGSFALYGEMGGFEGIYIGYESPVSVSMKGVLEFSIFSETDTEVVVVTSAEGVGDGVPKVIALPAGQWIRHRLPLRELGVQQEFSGVWWQLFDESDSSGVSLDEIIISSADNIATEELLPDDTRSPQQTPAKAEYTHTIYDDELTDGYNDWSWTKTNTRATDRVTNGDYSIYGRLAGWEALYIGRNNAIDLPSDAVLKFSIYSNGGASIAVQTTAAGDGSSHPVEILVEPGRWQQVAIPLTEFSSASTFTGVWWQQYDNRDSSGIYIDEVKIVGTAVEESSQGVQLRVSTETESLTRQIVDPASGTNYATRVEFPKPINDDIYGINFAPDSLREELAVPVSRWGGNAVERYNYLTSSSNQALDWYFTNNPMEPGADFVFERENERDNTDSILTVPMLGWVASGRDGICSYPIAEAGAQDDSVFHWIEPATECGNGYVNGEFLGVLDPARASIRVDENFAADWVRAMVAEHGSAAEGGVEYYALGNEPGLWHSTHGDVREVPMSREEIITRNIS